jgi:hypothetical protein
VEVNWWKVIRGGVVRVDGFAMRDDDWEVTRHHLPASLQPIRAEQIGWRWWFCRSKYEITLWAIITPSGVTESPLGAIVTRDTSHPSWGGA